MSIDQHTEINESKLMDFVFRAVGEVGATLNAALVVMGDKLGLYQALAQAGPLTPAELARRSGTAERYVQEWLNAQAAGGFVTYDPETGRYVPASRTGDGPHRSGQPRLPSRLLPARARLGPGFPADHGGGAHRGRIRLARARNRRPRRLRALLPARLQRQPDLRVAARARRSGRQAGARGAGGRRRLRPRIVHDPDGSGLPGLDLCRHRLPRRLDPDRTAAGQGRRGRRPGPVRDRGGVGLRRRRVRPGDHVRLPARHGRPAGSGPPCPRLAEARRHLDDRRALCRGPGRG